MINLLPTKQKELLKQERTFRIISSTIFFLFVFLISFIIILFFNKEIISIELERQAQSIVSQFDDEEIKAITEFEEEAKSYISNVKKINTFYSDTINITELLNDISDILPQGTYMTSISYGEKVDKDKTINEVSIYGFSLTRDDLIIFKDNLESKDRFKNIDFPSSNWVKSENINFTVTFEI